MTQLELPFDDDLSPETTSPGYLTIAEAAQIVRCHERTIRRAIERGALRAGRVRGANAARGGFRIRPRDLDRWLFTDDGDDPGGGGAP
jgi:excisionase family DNA binding protein